MTTVTVTFENELEARLKQYTRETGMSADEAVRDAIERHLHLYRFRSLQDRLAGYADQAGLTSEDDLLDTIS